MSFDVLAMAFVKACLITAESTKKNTESSTRIAGI